MNKNNPIAPDLGTRSYDALTAVTENGRTRTHGLSDMQERRNATLERIKKDGRGTRSHGRREVQPQTKTDLRRLKLGGLALGIALTGAALMSGGEDAPSAPEKAPSTTMVIAEPGDNLWKLQENNETFNGNDPRRVVSDLIDMNGGTTVYPGQEVKLIDYPDNNPPVTQP